jgi:hypothetical protein
MTGRTRVKESENVKFNYQFHEGSRSINLAVPRQEAALTSDSCELSIFAQ